MEFSYFFLHAARSRWNAQREMEKMGISRRQRVHTGSDGDKSSCPGSRGYACREWQYRNDATRRVRARVSRPQKGYLASQECDARASRLYRAESKISANPPAIEVRVTVFVAARKRTFCGRRPLFPRFRTSKKPRDVAKRDTTVMSSLLVSH